MMMADALVPEKTLLHLPSVVPSRPESGSTSACVPKAGVPGSPAEEDTGELASEEPGVRGWLPDPATRCAGASAGTAAYAGALEPTSVGSGERRVRAERL